MDIIRDLTSELKIKIVPKMTEGAGLNGEDFDCKLTETEECWFKKLRDMWNTCKDSPSVLQIYQLFLLQNPEPLNLALKFFANCPESTNLKNKNLAVFILQSTCNIHKLNPHISDDCDNNTRMVAFNFMKTTGTYNIIKAVIHTYNLRTIIDFIIPKLREMLAQGYYKDVAYWAMYLEITDHFDVLEIAFPLFLQDRGHFAEEYLSVAKAQQVILVRFLDTLLDTQNIVSGHSHKIIGKYAYPDIKPYMLNFRRISKLVKRLSEKYKVANHLTPNTNFITTSSHMRHLYFKYRAEGMSIDSWRELISDIANTKQLQLQVVIFIASEENINEAVYWLNQFCLNLEDLPTNIRLKLSDYCITETNINEDKAVQHLTNEYLQLSLPQDNIILVKKRGDFMEMLNYLKVQNLIAFDAEWKPSITNECTVALLQLATADRVYLVDCISIDINKNLWREMGTHIFNNMELLKIGFAIDQDLIILNRSLPLKLNLQLSNCYLDIKNLWHRLIYMQIINFPFGNGLHVKQSLSVLTELCLGKKLDKSNQCSNWAKRPLRSEQIIYAALDAHCLILIYNVLRDILKQSGKDADKIIDEVTSVKSGCWSRMQQNTAFGHIDRIRSMNYNNTKYNVKWSSDIKFICDYMLTGLSKELRKVGIDTINVENESIDIDEYVNIAKIDDRYILTSNFRYNLFIDKIMKNRCFLIPTDAHVKQLLNVFKILHIRVLKQHLFTRCMQCNSNEFILVEQRDMYTMCNMTGKRLITQKQYCSKGIMKIVPANEDVIRSRVTYRGQPIKFHCIRRDILESHPIFYVCDCCGNCTWKDASHLHRAVYPFVMNGV